MSILSNPVSRAIVSTAVGSLLALNGVGAAPSPLSSPVEPDCGASRLRDIFGNSTMGKVLKASDEIFGLNCNNYSPLPLDHFRRQGNMSFPNPHVEDLTNPLVWGTLPEENPAEEPTSFVALQVDKLRMRMKEAVGVITFFGNSKKTSLVETDAPFPYCADAKKPPKINPGTDPAEFEQELRRLLSGERVSAGACTHTNVDRSFQFLKYLACPAVELKERMINSNSLMAKMLKQLDQYKGVLCSNHLPPESWMGDEFKKMFAAMKSPVMWGIKNEAPFIIAKAESRNGEKVLLMFLDREDGGVDIVKIRENGFDWARSDVLGSPERALKKLTHLLLSQPIKISFSGTRKEGDSFRLIND